VDGKLSLIKLLLPIIRFFAINALSAAQRFWANNESSKTESFSHRHRVPAEMGTSFKGQMCTSKIHRAIFNRGVGKGQQITRFL